MEERVWETVRAEAVEDAVAGLRERLLERQNEDGSFSGNVDFNVWADAAYLILLDELGIIEDIADVKKDMLNRMNENGSWGALSDNRQADEDYKSTVIAYAALKRYGEDLPATERWLAGYGGSRWLDPYTEMLVKGQGEKFFFPPAALVYIPLWIGRGLGYLHMRFPKLFFWSFFLFPSGWTRNAFPQLQVVGTIKNNRRTGPLTDKALRILEKRILESQLKDGSWFDTILPTIGSLYALHLLGYRNNSICIRKGLAFLKNQRQESGRLNRFDLTIWNTALSLSSLLEAGSMEPETQSSIRKGIRFLTANQAASGGFAFTHNNKELPDHDDTALSLAALMKASGCGYRIPKETLEKGYAFLLNRQNLDGSFGAFDKNQSIKKPGLLPPYHVEYGHELKDPGTADVTGHALLALSYRKDKRSREAIRLASEWLYKDQVGGCWYGRWGLCYYYGTSRALIGLAAAGQNRNTVYVKRAVRFIENTQNADGGWGEDYRSYYSETPILAESTLEHTAWCLLTLMKYDYADSKTIDRGAAYLVKALAEGKQASYAAAAIEPACYEIYSLLFPLQALAEYMRYRKSR